MKLIRIKPGDIRCMMGMSQQEWSMGFRKARRCINEWASDILENSFTDTGMEKLFNEDNFSIPVSAEEFARLMALPLEESTNILFPNE
jgi:hypothetical protein